MMDRRALFAITFSASALVGLLAHEGYRQDAYLDSVGVPTVGFGTTDGVKLGDKTTVEKSLKRSIKDIMTYEAAVKQCVKVPLYQHEYDAYIQFSYNVGTAGFCKSTMVKKLNALDYTGACMEMNRWVYAGGKKLPGLIARRAKERDLCLGRLKE